MSVQSSPPPSNESTSQLLWILFSDANSRFNTLIEECAHLQDTIVGLTANPELVRKILSTHESTEGVRGFNRPVVCDPKVHPEYYDASVRDRAFISLWNSLGGVIKGLDRNQKQHEATYKMVVREANQMDAGHGASETVYWYVSQRGYFINTAFSHYTAQLEHAHEKLIQMLENQAGTLPNPILLRRWNSGAYGEFLSEYSRHVNWEAHTCVGLVLGNKDSATPLQSITHTWAHNPTSLTKYFDVNLGGGASSSQGPTAKRFAIIRSAYFYLEQPVLFPLLYHECVHINFPDNEKVENDYKSFFGSRLEANKSLRLAKFPVELPKTYDNFWDHFTEEVWADAMSIALGGRAYLMALALQLLGLSGTGEFNHYRVDDDTMYALDELGGIRHRKYEVPYPALELPFFWEARLLIACDVLKLLPSTGKDPHARAATMGASVVKLIEQWRASGNEAYKDAGTSVEHAAWWKYRTSLNDWVQETVLKHLAPTIAKLEDSSRVCSTYELASSNVRETIASAVNSYRSKYFHPCQGRAGAFTLEPNHRLENIAIDVRWALAHDIVLQMRSQPGQMTSWTSSFANWMRHDGGAAFRIALEACRVRLSLMDGLADHLIADVKNAKQSTGISARLAALNADYLRHDPDNRRKFLRQRGLTNSSKILNSREQEKALLDGINRIVDDMFASFLSQASEEVKVGTLSLGVVRPEEFCEPATPSDTRSPYLAALEKVERYMTASVETDHGIKALAKADGHLAHAPDFKTVFIRLVGEYQFLSFTRGSTPVERDAHPGPFSPRMLVKPRLVLQIGGSDLAYEERHRDMWARVTLIRFKYRWQWTDLKRQLDAEVAKEAGRMLVEYAMFLSSAWEDVILVTWHDSPDQLWNHEQLGLGIGSRDGVDTQSTFVVPESTYKTLPPKDIGTHDEWHKAMKEWAEKTNLVSRIYRRSGRYDYTVVWSEQSDNEGLETKSPLESCTMAFASMPAALWAQVQSMITSYELRVFEKSKPDVAKKPSLSKAITHFAIRDL